MCFRRKKTVTLPEPDAPTALVYLLPNIRGANRGKWSLSIDGVRQNVHLTEPQVRKLLDPEQYINFALKQECIFEVERARILRHGPKEIIPPPFVHEAYKAGDFSYSEESIRKKMAKKRT